VIVHRRVTADIEHSAHLSRVVCQCSGYFFPVRFFKHSGILLSSQRPNYILLRGLRPTLH